MLLEDNPHDVTFETAMIAGRAEVVIAQTLKEAFALADGDYDIALVDLTLPDGESDTFIGTYCNVLPIIVVSGQKQEERALECLRKGAQDYLIKGAFDEDLLWKTIMYSIERFNRMQLQRDRAVFRKKLARLQGIVHDLQKLNLKPSE